MFTAVFAFVPERPAYANPDQPGPFNRLLNWGFFWNTRHTSGDSVIAGGVSSNSLDQLVVDIRSRAENWCGCQSLQNIRGAQFIIKTMIRNTPNPNGIPDAAQINYWEQSVRSLVANGGSINFNAPIFFNINSYWQRPGDPRGDDAFYTISSGAYVWNPFGLDPDGVPVGNSIAFYDRLGNQVYAIRRACGNPVGQLPGLPDPVPFDLYPIVNVSVNGAPGSTTAEPGDTITFDYRVNNTTGTASGVTNCSLNNVNHAGYFPTPPVPEGGGTPMATSCPTSFPGNSSTPIAAVQNVTAGANTTVCRTLFVTPATPGGITRGIEACVQVISKPYLKVFGGDVSVGGGFETAADTCTNNANGAIIAWNRGTAGGYAGAGVQYAASALSAITYFASAQGNAGGAPVPTGLAFANTATNLGIGNYGGSYGSVPCINDYFSQKPTSGVLPFTGSLTPGEGIYQATGNTTLGASNVNPADKITLYVDGDLFITGNINYVGSWDASNIPMLKVVVRGNIYVSGGVTRLDGIFISQPNGVAGGTIYTCASGFSAPALAAGAFYSSCSNQLTVNGAFVARSVEFLRTRGTQAQSPGSEPGSIAEIFNFGPAFWMTQPAQGSGRVDSYDAITSLPPVL